MATTIKLPQPLQDAQGAEAGAFAQREGCNVLTCQTQEHLLKIRCMFLRQLSFATASGAEPRNS